MHFQLHCSLGLSAIVIMAVSGLPLPERTYINSQSLNNFQCKPVTNSTCAKHFNMRVENTWYARFPNARGLSLNRSINEFSDFSWLLELNNYCSHMLHLLLCFYYFPPCSPQYQFDLFAKPCQEVCREATDACLPIVRALRGGAVSIPRHLDCVNFTSRSSVGVRVNVATTRSTGLSTSVLACPNATIHVDFSLPAGKMAYKVAEAGSSLEVCLVLANVGSYSLNATLTTPVSVHLSTLQTNNTLYEQATPVVDYTPVSITLVFPVGSGKSHQICASVSIIDNVEINSDRAFSLKAKILSPSFASIGGSAWNTANIVEAVIIDDDDVHVGFKVPGGKSRYKSEEDRGYVEICLVLVNESQGVLNTAVNVTLTPIRTNTSIFVRAEPELDYSVVPVFVEFPAGSSVGHVECANISISVDGLVEADESFCVLATNSATSLNPVQFVGDQSPISALVEVIIQDDDECMIPADQCRPSCDTRDSANRGVFRNNCYSYAAHVELIGHRHLQGCSALDVTVLECWELQPGVCVSNGTRMSIPICQNCEISFTAGEELLVAGLYDTNVGMFLPNYKKGGLIGEWLRKYSSMREWIQIGINYKIQNPDTVCD